MPDESVEAPVFRVRIEAQTLSDLRAFTDETEPDLGCRPVARRSDTGFAIDVLLPEPRIEAVRSARAASRVSLAVLENATEVGRQRQVDVGQGDRFAARGEVPHGLGRKE